MNIIIINTSYLIINKIMSYILWIIFGLIASVIIYWLIDWESHNNNDDY
jgi:hypothetical protein